MKTQSWSRISALALAGLCVFCMTAGADSLFNSNKKAAKTGTLIAQKKARFEVGDIITVLVREDVDASTEANTNTRKESKPESEAQAGDNELLVGDADGNGQLIKPYRLPNYAIDAKSEHRSRGQTVRSSKLVTTVGCLVTQVLENGNIQIEGEKKVTVNRENSMLHVSGLVRAEDVTPAQTIESNRMAASTIELRGSGELWNNQRRGLVTRLLDWVSPF